MTIKLKGLKFVLKGSNPTLSWRDKIALGLEPLENKVKNFEKKNNFQL